MIKAFALETLRAGSAFEEQATR